MNRREFLKLVGLGTVGTVFLGACNTFQAKKYALVSPVFLADEQNTGVANWYASTCQQCSAGCGILVRVMEGRAKKIEGNPAHPVNEGRLCARGQAGLQVLYNPDRLSRPLKSIGARGAQQFVETNWDDATGAIVERLSAIQVSNSPDRLLFLTGSLRGSHALAVDRFTRSLGSSGYVGYELFGNDAYYVANRLVFGREALPDYDLENTNYVLSFGANFLETWLSPVHFSRQFGAMRQRRQGRRGKLVQIEPRMSLTAARADEWIPINPGTEGLLALGMASVIVAEGLIPGVNGRLPQKWRADLAEYALERVAQRTGVAEAEIRRLAREFASAQPGIAIGGASVAGNANGVASLVAINALNAIVGSVGVKGGIRFYREQNLPGFAPRPQTSFSGLKAAVDKLNSGQIDLVFIYGTNPVFTTPPGLGLAKALDKAGFVVAFSSFLDETSALADLVLPDNTFLETWGSYVPEYGGGSVVYSPIQPVVSQIFDTRPFVDVLLTLAKAVGGSLARSLPWESAQDIQKDVAQQLLKLNRGSIKEADAELFRTRWLQSGVWWEAGASDGSEEPLPATILNLGFEEPRFEGDAQAYPFHLHVYESIALSDGRGANLPWLQEMPDPLSTAVWSSWVEINPAVAQELGFNDGDPVWVESPAGKVLAPVLRFPGAMPNVVSIPVGQGHTAYGQYAEGRGVNPLAILAPLTDPQSGLLAHNATRVRITKATERVKLVKIERISSKASGKTFFD